MSTKKRLLTILEQQKGQTISGQELADHLDVSRTSIWKAISSLRKEGYPIEATTNKGYRLSTESDLLSSEAILPVLIPELRNQPFYVFKAIESTNQEAKKIAVEHPSQPAVVLSEEQIKGKGRLGRFFYSPANTGIYMTLILKPDLTTTDGQ